VGEYVRLHRAKNLKEMKEHGKKNSPDSKGGAEFILKNGLNFVEAIKTIRVPTKAQEQRLLKYFKDKGLAVFPDGRKVEEIVQWSI
jgi:hypothetical protein